MTQTAEQHGLQLPGYSLSRRLGAGGYGEVWMAQAPGGLAKAVKFVYGSFHDKRAEHELRALQRIKDLRHPFLLSLERIEVVGGRLAIVTELAESSLKDRFDQCLAEGLRGIPRDELLKYMRDAADALDFLGEKHGLQHLDVKPENLLLVGGHVKVADFGLVKDVGRSQVSMLGGLTPLYSAPEVFQGSPSARSDQYSLAVMYQELLTGALPFSGNTAAELTLQHLHDEPDLAPLPAADRYVLARALAKDPQQRFATCSDLAAALAQAADVAWNEPAPERASAFTASREPSSFEPPAMPRPRVATESFDDELDGPRKELSTSMLLDWSPPAGAEPRRLAPVELPRQGFSPTPALVVGIGGLAGSVLRSLRRRMTRQYGEASLPAVQLLLLDSDPKAVAQAMQGEPEAALTAQETVALPLRRPQEYREQSSQLLRWLSRRWLYNIPKSLRTEGLRPLGRLAFADHARQTVQRLRMALGQAMDAGALNRSSGVAGMPFRAGTARVYVVASISGGAGSGMSLDIGYAVRTALEKAGVGGAKVLGIFLHTAASDVRQCDLARVNAYAWLTEYNHLHRPDGAFPGDESCGLPPFPPGQRAFDAVYLVPVEARDAQDDDQRVESIAEYIFADALTPAQSVFDRCREAPASGGAGAPLRTFEIAALPVASERLVAAASARLSREVLLRWAQSHEQSPRSAAGDGLRDTDQIVHGVATLVSQLQLQLEGLACRARGLIDAQFGSDHRAFLEGQMCEAARRGPQATRNEMVRLVDALFAAPQGPGGGAYVLQRPLEAIVSPLTLKLAGDLNQWLLGKLDDRRERLAGAQRAVRWLIDHLTKVEAHATRLAGGLGKQIAAASDELRRESSGRTFSDRQWRQIMDYFRLRTDFAAVAASAVIARRLLADLKGVEATLAEFGRHLKNISASLPPVEPADPAEAELLNEAHIAALVEGVDQQLQDQFVAPHGGLFPTIMGNSRLRVEMLASLARLARRAVEQFIAQPEALELVLQQRCHDSAPLPKLLQYGGAYRTIAIVPGAADGAVAARLRHCFAGEATVVPGGRDVVICHEAWDVPLVPTAMELIQRRRDYADFAARVATRSDIPWAPLTLASSAASLPARAAENELLSPAYDMAAGGLSAQA
ncbi:MAG: hypothetical protein DCC67_17735 [Planctomycetota bacterium]|nr:MAG: hypothetical protein DCC67_17735 [Planctomycetota bacterium]